MNINESNRRNAALSTGPRTPEGKSRARLNSTRHGLTGQITTMPDADRTAHDRFCAALLKDLAPLGAMELQLAQSIATDSWRLNRLRAIEENMFAENLLHLSGQECLQTGDAMMDASFHAASTFRRHEKDFQLLSLYEGRITRNLHKNLKTLRELQAARLKSDAPKPMEKKNLPANGFVFSDSGTASAPGQIPLVNRSPGGANPSYLST